MTAFRFTKADQPSPTLMPFWVLEHEDGTTQELRMDVMPPVQRVVNFLRDAADPEVGEDRAAWSLLEDLLPADDYAALSAWPMTANQASLVMMRVFQMIAAEGRPED